MLRWVIVFIVLESVGAIAFFRFGN